MNAFSKPIYDLLSSRHRERALKQLRALESKLHSPWARFAVPFCFRGKGHFKKLEPRQNPIEIESLYQEVCELHPCNVLEIGTARGGTLYLWAQAATADATIVSVDLPGGDFGGAYPECRIPFYEAFAREKQTLTLIRDDSHTEQTLQRVKDQFRDPIDFAFIDGDHTYEGVKQDFEMYGPLVRPGGIIAFHDILPRPESTGIEVDRFWNEIKESHDAVEFIGPTGTGKVIGIGMIRVGGTTSTVHTVPSTTDRHSAATRSTSADRP